MFIMSGMGSKKRQSAWLFALCSLLFALCAAVSEAEDKTPFNITLTISGIEAKKKEGLWVPLLPAPVTVNSIEMVDNQILLSELDLPAGKYDRLRVRFSKATWVQDENTFELIYPAEGMEFNYSFQVLEDDITPVFMTWEPERCIRSHIRLSPCFSFEGKAVHLPEVVGYVTSEATGLVYVIDRNRNNVISIIRTGPSPKGIAANPDANRAYVVNSGSDTVSVIDTRYGRVIYTLNLETGSKSEAIALADDGKKLFVTNSATNSVSAIDASTYKMIVTIPVSINPVFVVAEPRGKKVYVVNNYSHEVSVIDTSRDAVVGIIRVEQYPETASIDAAGDKLYVVSPRSGHISIMPLSAGSVARTLRLTGRPFAVLPDTRGNRLFVAKEASGRIVLYDLLLEDDILANRTGKFPRYIAIDEEIGRLYIVNGDSATVDVFDVLTLKRIKTIQVGKKPWQMVLVK